MKNPLAIGALAVCLAATPAQSEDFNQHIIVVLDNSGTVQDDSGQGARSRPSYMMARRAMIGKIEREYSRSDLITIVSVAGPQVIWQGPASEITDRRNYILADYLNAEINGCADFERVADTIQRELRYSEPPLTQLIFLSSLVHTNNSPEGCAVDPDHLHPPEPFFEALKDLQFETKAQLSFLWTYDDVASEVADYFDANGIRVILKQEKLTSVEMAR